MNWKKLYKEIATVGFTAVLLVALVYGVYKVAIANVFIKGVVLGFIFAIISGVMALALFIDTLTRSAIKGGES